MNDWPVRKFIAIFLSILIPVVLGVSIEIYLNKIFGKLCLFEPLYLIVKDRHVYVNIIVFSLITNYLVNKIFSYEGVPQYRKNIKCASGLLIAISIFCLSYIYFYYGNYRVGACSDSNVNTHYYEYPGQNKYIK